ncbi:MAG: hypothetical protein FE042_04780 [Thermoplasmata archaeon]|nr:MAG: hypothetical protein FE042_04780 [Thermoplasmata archaeon]
MSRKTSTAIHFLSLILILVTLSAAMGSADENNQNGISKWTVILYFDGDQHATTYSLSDKMLADLQSLEKAATDEDVKFIVLMDLDSIGDTHLYCVEQNEAKEIPLSSINASWNNEVNMGDGNTLTQFVCWTITNYPAEHYNLYLNDHGGGWRGICVDENPVKDILNLTELKTSLITVRDKIGKKIDVISMDACLMSMIEVAYQLRECADYMVASESFIHTHQTGNGIFLNWRLDRIYSNLTANPDMDPSTLAMICVENFRTDKAFILPPSVVKPQAVDCIGAIDLSAIARVAEFVDNLSKHLMIMKHLRFFIPFIFLKTQKFSGAFDFLGYTFYPYVDLYDFSKNVATMMPYPEIKELSGELMRSIERAVIAERHGKNIVLGEHPRAHGLSIYFPYRMINYDSGYENLDFSRDTNWDEFIRCHWLMKTNVSG